jgi:hypothetical protein
MPEALSTMMRGAMDWAYRSAFRLFAAAPWPPRFRGADRSLPFPITRAWGGVLDWLSVLFGLCQGIDEQQHAYRRHQHPRHMLPISRPLLANF